MRLEVFEGLLKVADAGGHGVFTGVIESSLAPSALLINDSIMCINIFTLRGLEERLQTRCHF